MTLFHLKRCKKYCYCIKIFKFLRYPHSPPQNNQHSLAIPLSLTPWNCLTSNLQENIRSLKVTSQSDYELSQRSLESSRKNQVCHIVQYVQHKKLDILYNVHILYIVASTPAVTDQVFLHRFRLFLRHCGFYYLPFEEIISFCMNRPWRRDPNTLQKSVISWNLMIKVN